jgi:hypothetical protein
MRGHAEQNTDMDPVAILPYGGIIYCTGRVKTLVLVSQDLTQIFYLFLSPDSALGLKK